MQLDYYVVGVLQKIDPVMSSFLKDYSKNVPLAVVGGSDIAKITEQLGDSIEDCKNKIYLQ